MESELISQQLCCNNALDMFLSQVIDKKTSKASNTIKKGLAPFSSYLMKCLGKTNNFYKTFDSKLLSGRKLKKIIT